MSNGNNVAERVVNRMFDQDWFSQWLGIERKEISPGRCVLSMVIRKEMLNGFAIAALLLILTYPMQMLIVMSLAYLALIPLSVRRFLAYQHEDEMAAGQGGDGQEAPPSAPAGGH